jgi:WD40 repeat protein
MTAIKNIFWMLLLMGAGYVGLTQAAEASASSASASSFVPAEVDSSGELTKDELDFLLYYNGDVLPDQQALGERIVDKLKCAFVKREIFSDLDILIYACIFSPDGGKIIINGSREKMFMGAPMKEEVVCTIDANTGVLLSESTDAQHIADFKDAVEQWGAHRREFSNGFRPWQSADGLTTITEDIICPTEFGKANKKLTAVEYDDKYEKISKFHVHKKNGDFSENFYITVPKLKGNELGVLSRNGNVFLLRFDDWRVFLYDTVTKKSYQPPLTIDDDQVAISPDGKALLARIGYCYLGKFTILSFQQQLLWAKMLKKRVIINSKQRERLQAIAYELPEWERNTILKSMPLLKKEYDGTCFAQHFLTNSIALHTRDGRYVELTPEDIQQRMISEIFIALKQESARGKISHDDSKKCTIVECPFDSDKLSCFMVGDFEGVHATSVSEKLRTQENIFEVYDFLQCHADLGGRSVAETTALFIRDNKLASFGLNLFLPLITGTSCNCCPFSADYQTQGYLVRSWSFTPNADYSRVSYPVQLSFSPHGRSLLALTSSHGVKLWDMRKLPAVYCLSTPGFYFNSQSPIAWGFDADDKEFAVCSHARCKIVRPSGDIDVSFPCHEIANLMYLDANTLIAFCRGQQKLYCYNIAEQRIALEIPIVVEPHEEGQHAAGGVEHVEHHDIRAGRATVMTLSPDKTMLAVGRQNGTISIVDPHSPTLDQCLSLRRDTAPIDTLAYSPDGSLLASYAHDRTLRIYDAISGALIRTFNVTQDVSEPVLTISADNRQLALVVGCGRVNDSVIFDIESGTERVMNSRALFDPSGLWLLTKEHAMGRLQLQPWFSQPITAEQYLLLEKALHAPELFSSYLTQEERDEMVRLQGERLKKENLPATNRDGMRAFAEIIRTLDEQQKSYLSMLCGTLPDNMKSFVKARMPWLDS